MTRHTAIVTLLVLAAFLAPAASAAQSPYAGQETRAIASLSPAEVDGYLAGEGMGLARAAELNGHPGPAHVLELSAQLGLSPEQRARTETLFRDMKSRAVALGEDLVRRERALDRLFADGTPAAGAVAAAVARVAEVRGRLRTTHLQAHLEQIRVLTPSQVRHYNRLRGYGAHGEGGGHEHGGGGHGHE